MQKFGNQSLVSFSYASLQYLFVREHALVVLGITLMCQADQKLKAFSPVATFKLRIYKNF